MTYYTLPSWLMGELGSIQGSFCTLMQQLGNPFETMLSTGWPDHPTIQLYVVSPGCRREELLNDRGEGGTVRLAWVTRRQKPPLCQISRSPGQHILQASSLSNSLAVKVDHSILQVAGHYWRGRNSVDAKLFQMLANSSGAGRSVVWHCRGNAA